NWGYNYSQQIYLASEYNASVGNENPYITKIRFYYNGIGAGEAPGTSPATTNFQDWVVYLGNTSKTSFSSTTDWIELSELTEVYSGVVTFPEAGNWMEITFDTPFIW